MNLRLLALALLLVVVTGCATSGYQTDSIQSPAFSEVPNPYFEAIGQSDIVRDKDRLAILAMQGDYRVDFQFQETVPLMPGYEFHDDKTTGGFETVVLVDDSADRIVLQHLLVAPGGHVIKHWRQDWTFEAAQRVEFVANQQWETKPIESQNRVGAWTQCVFEVSDAPRYCGTGRWNHRYGVSTWTSDRSWRPLPRREYTKRDDYNAINAQNRHTVTPAGWTHEQDNTKVVRDGRTTVHTLVREFGFNHYRSIEGYDFSTAAKYWRDTSRYWAMVRNAWDTRLQLGNTLTLNTDVDGMPIIVATFEQANRSTQTSLEDQRNEIENLLNQYSSLSRRPESGMSGRAP